MKTEKGTVERLREAAQHLIKEKMELESMLTNLLTKTGNPISSEQDQLETALSTAQYENEQLKAKLDSALNEVEGITAERDALNAAFRDECDKTQELKAKLMRREDVIETLKAGLQRVAESFDIETIEDPLRRKYDRLDGTVTHIYIKSFATTYRFADGKVISFVEED